MAKNKAVAAKANDPKVLRVQVAAWSAATGTTKGQLAEMLGISQPFLSQIISGTRPGKDYVNRIIEITRIA